MSFFFSHIRQPPISTLFPYTTLFRSISYVKENVSLKSQLYCASASLSSGRGWPNTSSSFSPIYSEILSLTSLLISSNKMDFPYRSEEHTSELQSRENLVCRLLLEKKK